MSLVPRKLERCWHLSRIRNRQIWLEVRSRGDGSEELRITGVGGFVAPRHLKAIQDTGNRLVAAADPHDAVGILDRFSFDVRFFTEFERFDRHLEKLRRGPEARARPLRLISALPTTCTMPISGWRCGSGRTPSARSRW